MKVLAIAATNLRRLLRDPSTLFFVFILPLALVLLIGSLFGGEFTPRLGVVATQVGALGDDLVAALDADPTMDLIRYDDDESMVAAVERGALQAGLLIPDGYDASLRSGGRAELGFVARPEGTGPQLQATVSAAVSDQQALVKAARFAQAEGAGSFEESLRRAEELAAEVPGVRVEVTSIGEAVFPATLGRFDLGASSQLILFMFLTGLTGASALIQTRRLGVSRRMLSTPTPAGAILGGEALGRFGVVFVQGAYIMVGSWVAFSVDFGDLAGALAILVLFALVGAGAGMLMGAVFSNDQQAGGIAVLAGLGLAALGGAMMPIEFFSPAMQRVAHITPHAWALDGFAELVRRGGTLADILPELGVLAAYAAVLLALATWRLRTVLTR